MTRAMIKAAQRHALVRLDGFDVAWHTMTGGGRVALTTDDPDTDTGQRIIIGDNVAEDITLTTSFSPRQDLEWMRVLKAGVGTLTGSVTRYWTDENWAPVGEPEVYPDCILIGYTNPASSPSGDEVEFSITLHTSGEAL